MPRCVLYMVGECERDVQFGIYKEEEEEGCEEEERR